MEKRIIANMKSLGIDMINASGNGHPGIVLGAASIMYTLYAKHLNINPHDPYWVNRDRFVLSAGHGSALLYANLFLAGFDLSKEDLKNFRRIGYKTPGHPEYNITPGVDVSTGPLGQGIASAVGMAVAAKMLKEKHQFSKEMHNERDRFLIDYNIYVLCGDGDLMEGISYEAASLAGTLNLDNLIILYDSNHVSLDGDTSNTFVENVLDRFKAMGWDTYLVNDGNDINDIDHQITRAKKSLRPSFIEIKTTIGDGSLLAGSNTVHGKPLSDEDILQLKNKLQISNTPFYIDEEAKSLFRAQIADHSNLKYNEWVTNYREYVKDCLNGDDSTLQYLFSSGIKTNILNFPWHFADAALRDVNGSILTEIGNRLSSIVVGSADLSSSTKTYITGLGDFKEGNYNGRNIWFGVREGAMGAILNGLALSKLRPIGTTFLSFADYMKPAIRMAALMKLPVTYIFTHDSVAIGADGPTHQPVEQLAMLRTIPNLNVYRPADGNEIVGCYNEILNSNFNPSALIISKEKLDILPTSDKLLVSRGAYIIRKEKDVLSAIIIATGSEVKTAYNIANSLFAEAKIDIRVVSMPVMELYLKQDKAYQQFLLPKGVKTFVIEAGSASVWHQFVYDNKYILTIDQFGVSGTKDEVLKALNFDYEQLKKRIFDLLN
ncbi:MAG: transketolase [Bacilli bacterium]